jgi:hypothetical protein
MTTAAPPLSTAPTTTAPVPVSPEPTTITVFRVENGALRAESERVPRTRAVAAAALGALGLPAAVTIGAGTAHVALDHAAPGAIAEIVYTLTRFPSVQRVDVAGRSGLTRADFGAYLAPILVEEPAARAEVPADVEVSGSASVFEATVVVELARDGTVLDRQTVSASEGAPARGTFTATLHAPSAGPATLSAFSPSAVNGEPQHRVDVPVTVKP